MAGIATSPFAHPHEVLRSEIPALQSSDTVLEFSGRFRFGIDQWAYVPFPVPPGVQRLRVDVGHSKFAVVSVARNVLDLGIFGPDGYDVGNAAGFRGWSGGARETFMVSEATATPGYLPGPITPGTWALAMGPVVLNPLGMSWWARVVLEYGAPAPAAAPAPVSVRSREPRGAGWYRGDLHTHTVHSDGRCHPDELAAAAAAAGLDFLASTEHNTNAANLAWESAAVDPVVVCGEEVTTRHGHWLAIGMPPQCWIDWRYTPRERVFAGFARQVREAGGLVVAAHPAAPVPGAAWEFGYRDVDAIEVWNGRWNLDDEVALRIWHRLLVRGRRIAAVGGSDSHGEHQRVGYPQTVVRADELETSALVAALREGRCYLAQSDAVTVDFRAEAQITSIDRCTRGPGASLSVPPDGAVTVSVTVKGTPDCVVTVITAEGRAAQARVDGSGSAELRWQVDAHCARFARVEVRSIRRRKHAGSMVALTNPIWLTAS